MKSRDHRVYLNSDGPGQHCGHRCVQMECSMEHQSQYSGTYIYLYVLMCVLIRLHFQFCKFDVAESTGKAKWEDKKKP